VTSSHKSQETEKTAKKKKRERKRKAKEKLRTNFVLTLWCPTSSTAMMFKHSLHNRELVRKKLGRRRKGPERIC